MNETLSAFIGRVPVDKVRAAEGRGMCPALGGVNAHIHLPPNFSAFESVADAVGSAAREGIRLLGASNYYDYTVYSDFISTAMSAGVYPVLGIEIVARDAGLAERGIKINDPGNPGKMYICGKGITRVFAMPEEAKRILSTIRASDTARMQAMVERLTEVFQERGVETGLDEAAVIAMVVRRHRVAPETVILQERHVAQAFQEALFEGTPAHARAAALERVLGARPKDADDPVAVQNDIRSHLMKAGKPGFVEESFVTPEEAKRLILALGGFPAYPTFADGGGDFTPFEAPVEALIANIRGMGVHAAEFIPVRNRPEVLAEYVLAMRRAGLVVTAGTEHNTLDRIPLVPTCLGGAPVPEDVQAIFDEGARVLAAHQFLTLNGETGYVEADGTPNRAYASDEERIEAFARLGGAVLETYYGLAKV